MRFAFSKYAGCGNDFILIDNRKQFFPADQLSLVQKLCQRCIGIGADGVILLENSLHSDFRMRIFNADGQEAEMCGNGIRCLMKFIQAQGINLKTCSVETYLRPLIVHSVGEDVSVEMGAPFDLRFNIPMLIDGVHFIVHHVNTGVPHVILFTENLEGFDLNTLGPKFRYHTLFAPQGANFNVVQQMENGILWNRTYERGVEGETLGCGTGCAAVAIAANQILGLKPPIKVRTRSGGQLEITFNAVLDSLTMTGPATKVFTGEIEM